MTDQVEQRFFGTAVLIRSDQDQRKVRMSVSSETPVKRWDSWEILSHKPDHVDLSFLGSGNAPLLSDHDRYGGQVGVVTRAFISKGRLLADVRFSKSEAGEREYRDVLDGIRNNVSIGYSIQETKQAGEKEGRPVRIQTQWTPLEVSLVSIPADRTVGTNRSGGLDMAKKVEPGKVSERDQIISEYVAGGWDRKHAESHVDNMLTRAAAPINENKDTLSDCLALQRAHNLPPSILEEVAAAGGGLQQYREKGWEYLKQQAAQTQASSHFPQGNISPGGRGFSISRLLRAMMDPTNPRVQREAALELDVCAEAAERQVGNREIRGTLVPVEALMTRTLQAGTATGGAELVGTVVDGSRFAEFLRARSIAMNMGATVMDWSGSNLSIPRLDDGSNAAWVATEGGPAAESDPVTGALALSPKTLMAYTSYTKRLLVSSSPQVDQIVNQDLAGAIAAAVDAAIIQGSGASGQPLGLLNDPLLPTPITFAGANPTFAEVVQMETTVDTADHLVGPSLGYVAHPGLVGGMKTTDKGTDTGSFLWEGYPGRPGFGMVNGYPALSSSSCGTGNMVFGAWREMFLVFWLSLDLTVDIYSQAKSGIVEVVAHVECDLGARRPKSFIVGQTPP